MNETDGKNKCQYQKVTYEGIPEKVGILGVRHLQTAFLSAVVFLSYMIRVNMSIAIVDMTDTKRVKHFDWDLKVQSVILSSFFWGYLLMQVPGGALATRFGGKVLIMVSLTINSLTSLLIPTVANIGGWYPVCACRILQGLSQGLLFPSMHHLISQWIPFEEKGRLSTLIYGGGPFGIAVQLMYSGFLATKFGWESIFYVNGTFGAICVLAYAVFGSARPESNRLISNEELKYIQNSLKRQGKTKRIPTPWRKIFSSVPVWAIIISHAGQSWGFYTLVTEMPTYMAKVLRVNLKSNGVLSSLPYLSMFVFSFVLGFIADLIIKNQWLSVTNTRKLFNTIGFWGPAAALIGLSYCPEGKVTIAVVLLTLTVGMDAGQYSGFLVTHTDLAPNFSAILMGISNGFGTMFSILAPIACGLIINDEKDPAEWRKVFFCSSAFLFSCNLIFLICGTAKRQSWNEPKEIKNGAKTPPLLSMDS